MSSKFARVVFGLVVIGLLVISFGVESEARYMPTRADPGRREQIRELLKTLLELSPVADVGPHAGYGAYEYGAPASLKGLERSD